jgi:hypothetical protein
LRGLLYGLVWAFIGSIGKIHEIETIAAGLQGRFNRPSGTFENDCGFPGTSPAAGFVLRAMPITIGRGERRPA